MNNPRCDIYVSGQFTPGYVEDGIINAYVELEDGWGQTFTTHIDTKYGEMENLKHAKEKASGYALEYNKQFFVVMEGMIVFVATPRPFTEVQGKAIL